MYTFYKDQRVHDLAAQCYSAGMITAVLCDATCLLLKCKLDGKLLVHEKTWPRFRKVGRRRSSVIPKPLPEFWPRHANVAANVNLSVIADGLVDYSVRV